MVTAGTSSRTLFQFWNVDVSTIAAWLEGIGRTQSSSCEACPCWPPDLFALAGTLIRRSGVYMRLFKDRDPAAWVSSIDTVAKQWRQQLDSTTVAADLPRQLPPEISQLWDKLIALKDRPINDIDLHPDLAEGLIRLTLIADEASRGIGIATNNKPPKPGLPPPASNFLALADEMLVENEQRSFCWDIPRSILCVLGKQHTPAKGATFRSLSHHLALYQPSEIEARWLTAIPTDVERHAQPRGLNLLLLPWPLRVESQDFVEVPPIRNRADGTEPPGYFRYRPHTDKPDEFKNKLTRALDTALAHTRQIDAVVLPELALTPQEYLIAEDIAYERGSILICGVRNEPSSEQHAWETNECILQAAGAVRRVNPTADSKRQELLNGLGLKQAKHHRWYVDRPQIVSYQLAGTLSSSRGVWENIDLPGRLLHFVTLNPITWSVLICEDLARQEPAADLIRAVGPNLLIALLMDGPQMSSRWPARYAAVLAEDPGTSVLTLTSLGMAERSRPILGSGQRAPASRIIALWRDAIEGEIQIALDPDHDACLLSLEYQWKTEYCADGRSDDGQTCYPVYAGYRSFKS